MMGSFQKINHPSEIVDPFLAMTANRYKQLKFASAKHQLKDESSGGNSGDWVQYGPTQLQLMN